MKGWALCWMVLLSCSFDEDAIYYPKTRANYLMVSENGNKRIIEEVAGNLNEDWLKPINPGPVSDMAGEADELWFSDIQNARLFRVNLRSARKDREIALPEIRPAFICLGDRHILVSDTLNDLIALVLKKDGEVVWRNKLENPGKAVFRGEKFYVPYAGNYIGILYERSLSIANMLTTKLPIQDLVVDNGVFTRVYTGINGIEVENRIDFNSDDLSGSEVTVNFQKTRWSPYISADFGKEWVGSISLQRSGVLGLPIPIANVRDFEIDFFESRAFYLRTDSLFIRDFAGSSAPVLLGQISGRLIQIYSYQEFVE